ncbi:MAG: protein phosphatase CheZ [Gammaproteobacteria bacterium]|nr:protein phosphatase CheZ [Gammaproteobacteria bacterium]
MENNPLDKQALLEKARSLVSLLENDDVSDQDLDTSLDEIMSLRDASLFHELGKMTREIHDSIMNFRMDSRISDLAETDIPDAKDRLEYVITMTENAANTVLTVVEKGSPVAERLSEQARHLAEQWARFRNRELSADELREMGQEVEGFFSESESMMTELLSGFTEVLMAQDFQDLTGQIIRRVINLVDEIEGNLVELIKIQGEHYIPEETKAEEQNKEKTKLEGPQVPGKETSDDVMKGQDDVDDLLASLGF